MKSYKGIVMLGCLLASTASNANHSASIASASHLHRDTSAINYYNIEPFHDCATIDLVKHNVLYIGIDNALDIFATYDQTAKVSVVVKGGGGTITKSGGTHYSARVTTPDDNCNIIVYINDKFVYSHSFRARYIPPPHGMINNQVSGSNILTSELCEAGGIDIKEILPFDIEYKLLTYTIKLVPPDGTNATFENTGAKFNDQAKEAMCGARPGSILYFENIVVEEEGGRKLILPALFYYIQ
jgi:hypothetical protein